jgi:glycyl-tRNA synthetase
MTESDPKATTAANTAEGTEAATAVSAVTVEQLQDELDALNANITKVGSRIRELKKSNASTSGDTAAMDELTTLIQSLQELKLQASQKSESIVQIQNNNNASSSSSSATTVFQRKVFDDLMIRKMFIIPSFEIHGGVKGLFDLGPPACSLKVRIVVFASCWMDVIPSCCIYNIGR